MEKQIFHFRRNEPCLWEKRICHLFDSEAVKISKQETQKAKEATKQEAIKAKLRISLAKLGIPWEETTQTGDNSQPKSEIETHTTQREEITGTTIDLGILHKISTQDLEKNRITADRINDLLAGKNIQNEGKRARLQEAGQAILQRLDPTYTRPQTGDLSQEAQKVVAKIVKKELDKETLKKIGDGDFETQALAARKIKEVYALLESARRLHKKDIRKNTRGKLLLSLGEKRSHRKGLLFHSSSPKKFETKKAKTLKIAEKESKYNRSPLINFYTLDEKKRAADEAWKPEGKLKKALYYGPLAIPALAHRAVLRPVKLLAKFLIRNLLVRPTAFVLKGGKKILEKSYNFLMDKTFRKGPAVGIARSALWIGGSAITGGLPIIPAITEGLILAGKKMKLDTGIKKVSTGTKYTALNVANIATLGIPHLAFNEIKKLYEKIKINPSKK